MERLSSPIVARSTSTKGACVEDGVPFVGVGSKMVARNWALIEECYFDSPPHTRVDLLSYHMKLLEKRQAAIAVLEDDADHGLKKEDGGVFVDLEAVRLGALFKRANNCRVQQ